MRFLDECLFQYVIGTNFDRVKSILLKRNGVGIRYFMNEDNCGGNLIETAGAVEDGRTGEGQRSRCPVPASLSLVMITDYEKASLNGNDIKSE